MNRIKKSTASLTLLSALLLAGLTTDTSFGVSDKETTGVGFYVSAQIPDNQIDTSLTYFDLRMQPGQEQSLAVSIVNTGPEQITVEVSAISASTNQNGIIDYRTPDIRDETLIYPFSELANVTVSEISVPAYGTETAYIDLTMPDESYDGVILGGIVIAQKEDIITEDMLSVQNGSAIINQYAYILGVKLTETDVIIPPAFELVNVIADSVNYRPALVHYLRNTEAAIVKNLKISMTVSEPDAEKLIFDSRLVIDMAPNSTIRLPAFIDSGTLQPGTYHSQMTLDYEGSVTNLYSTFTIEREQINIVNSTIIEESSSFPFWIWIVIPLLAIILILIIFLIILTKHRKDKDDRDQEEPEQRNEPENQGFRHTNVK